MTFPTRSAFAGVCVALLALLAAKAPAQQGFSATATVVPNSASNVDALQKQIAALEKRVAELEKEKAKDIDVKDDAEEQAAKKLEQRLANLERNQAAAKPAGAATTAPADDTPLTVTAPFTVVDSDGKPLLRVAQEGDGFSRGVYVYNGDAKVVAHLGAQSGGHGRVYLSDGEGPLAVMSVQSEGARLLLGVRGSEQRVRIDSQSLRATIGDASLAFFGTTDNATGYMELANSAGQKLVGARINSSGLGIVETGPLDGGAAVSILGGRPASSLIGKKN